MSLVQQVQDKDCDEDGHSDSYSSNRQSQP